MPNKIIPYNPILKERARLLRKNMTFAEVLIWQKIRRRALGVQFHRQVPMLNYIVDFYCHEIGLAIEIDGSSHDHKYFYDARRQGLLEEQGVKFVRFSNDEVQHHLFSVLQNLQVQVDQLKNEQGF